MFKVDPADWHKLAYKLEGIEYWDAALQWGLRNGVEISMRFTCALIYILNRHNIYNVFGVIDDFLLLFEPNMTLEACKADYEKACSIFDKALGPNCRNTKPGKSQPPLDDVEFCGNRYSSTYPYIACRPAMRQKISTHIDSILASNSNQRTGLRVQAHALDTLVGRISYSSQTLWGVATFYGPLLHAQQRARAQNKKQALPYNCAKA